MPDCTRFHIEITSLADFAAFVAILRGEATPNELDQVLAQLGAIGTQETHIMATIQDVKAQADKALAAIANESDKDDAIIALVTANTAVIAALKQQLADAIAALPPGTDAADLQAVLDSLTTAESSALANAQRVVDAVNANSTPTA